MTYQPPHQVTDTDKLNEMIAILENGGELPPVLVNGDQAYSGSHRIAAWKILDMDQEVVELSDDEYQKVMEELNLDPMYDIVTDFEVFLDAAASLGFSGDAK